jgi:cysteine desulfurase / selenocysteine lyase
MSLDLTDHDIETLRAQTPGCNRVIHLNCAGAGLMSVTTLSAMRDHLERESTNGAMEAGASVACDIEDARQLAATLIGANASEIAFLSSGSLAWGSAFAALPQWKAGDRVLVSRQEWGSNVSLMMRAALNAGARVEVTPCREDGAIDVDALERIIDERVKLIAVTWLPANGGLINDAAGVGRVARAARIPYFLDAGQAVGQLPIDVKTIGCDILKSAGRKHLRGPRGTALLFVRSDFSPRLEPAFFDVQGSTLSEANVPTIRKDARRFEMQETSIAALIGMGVALREASNLGVERTWARIRSLADFARRELKRIPGVEVHDLGAEQSGLISFAVDGIAPMQLKEKLATKGINIGANGVAYTPLDMRARSLQEIARLSLSYLTTQHEIEASLQAIKALTKHG